MSGDQATNFQGEQSDGSWSTDGTNASFEGAEEPVTFITVGGIDPDAISETFHYDPIQIEEAKYSI